MYDRYYEKHGADRNDLLTNSEVVFQTFAFDRANIRALQRLPVDRDKAKVLDVGCGAGASLIQFIRLGFRAENLSGVDSSQERIAQARASFPNVDFRWRSADSMDFADPTFDIAFGSTLFMMLTVEYEAQRIASLFDVGRATDVVARERGALVPPLGRLLPRRAPSLYFAVQALFPFAVGQITTVLRKR